MRAARVRMARPQMMKQNERKGGEPSPALAMCGCYAFALALRLLAARQSISTAQT